MQSTNLAADVENYLAGLIGYTPGAISWENLLPVFPWESKFVAGAFKPGVLDAALTVARGNGKSTLLAGIMAATVDKGGPLNYPNAESLLVSGAFAQATIAFRHILRMLAPTLERYPKLLRVRDSQNMATIQNRETGALLRCCGSDPRRLMGAAPALVLGR